MPDDPAPTTDPTTTTPPTEPSSPPAPPADDHLGDAGKAALESERKARREAEKIARETAAELEKLRNASLTDQEKAVAEARREGERAGLRRLLEAEIRAAAAGALANPAIAARLLDVEALMPKAGEEVDGERIAAAIAELVEREPYLRQSVPGTPPPADPPKPPTGTVPAGPRGDGTGTGAFKRSQLRDPAFYAANKDAILAAAREGRITDD